MTGQFPGWPAAERFKADGIFNVGIPIFKIEHRRALFLLEEACPIIF